MVDLIRSEGWSLAKLSDLVSNKYNSKLCYVLFAEFIVKFQILVLINL